MSILLERGAFVLFLLGITAGRLTHAASLDVSPLQVLVPPDGRPVAVRVENNGDEAVLIRASAVRWAEPEELDTAPPAGDIVLAPPIFELLAGQEQVLRVALRRPLAGPREQAYRLVINEVARELPTINGVVMSLRVNLPMFATPQGGKPLAGWDIRQGSDGRAEVVVSNMGTARIVVSEVAIRGPTGQDLHTANALKTVLAAGSASWPLDVPLGELPEVVEVRADTNHGPLVAQVRPGG